MAKANKNTFLQQNRLWPRVLRTRLPEVTGGFCVKSALEGIWPLNRLDFSPLELVSPWREERGRGSLVGPLGKL